MQVYYVLLKKEVHRLYDVLFGRNDRAPLLLLSAAMLSDLLQIKSGKRPFGSTSVESTL